MTSEADRRSLLALASLMVFVIGGARAGLDDTNDSIQTRITEVPVQLLSAEITRFQRPLRAGANRRGIEYGEALVLKVSVEREAFDALPPNIEPFLYVGRNEYRVFHIDRDDHRQSLILTFHILKWDQLEDDSQVTLTIDHGAPIRHGEKYSHQDAPRFHTNMIVDRR